MNILLTGGNGYIGSHVAVSLASSGHNPILFDNLSNSSASVVEKICSITNSDIPLVVGDIHNEGQLVTVLKQHNVDSVIHLAGSKSVGESMIKPLEYYKNNIAGTIALCSAMQKAGVKKMVFSSSANVYGEPKYLPIDESHPECPTNPYGRTKLYIERMLQDISSANPCLSIIALRYFNPVGAHASGLLGENPLCTPNNLMPFLIRVAAEQLPELRVYGHDYDTPDGTGIRDYIHVVDLAAGHVMAVEYMTDFQGWDVFNLGTGRGYSVLEIINTFQEVTKRRVNWAFAPRRHGDVPASYANPVKAKEKLGWCATHEVSEMCETAWMYMCNVSSMGFHPSKPP